MRLFLVFILVCLQFTAHSQGENLYKIDKNRIVFETVIQLPELNRFQLKDTVVSVLERFFESRFTIKDGSDSTLSGSGSINNTKFYSNYNQLNFDYTIKFRDGRLKIKFERIIISGLIESSESIDMHFINNDGTLKKGGKTKRYSNELNSALQRFLTEFTGSLQMKNEHTDDGDENDDW
jgi:hypothetical protein